MNNEKLKISVNGKKEYSKVLKGLRERNFTFSYKKVFNESCNRNIQKKDEGIDIILDTLIELLFKENSILLAKSYDKNLQKFLKVVIYDLIDLKIVVNRFIGSQIFAVYRSIIERLDLYLLCILDSDFRDYYFQKYNSKDEKIKRYKENKPSRIKNKLKEIQEKYKEDKFLGNILYFQELRENMYDFFSEIIHLNEFKNIEEVIDFKNDKILFYEDKKLNYDEWLDIFFRYLIDSILMITILNLWSVNCSLKDDRDIKNICDYLNELSEKLESYYKMEKILQHIANKAKEILGKK